MIQSTTKPTKYKSIINPIYFPLFKELHKEEKTIDELAKFMTKKLKIKIILKKSQGREKDAAKLSNILLYTKGFTFMGLHEMVRNGLVNEKKYAILKEAKGNKPEIRGSIYSLTELGQNVYQNVYR